MLTTLAHLDPTGIPTGFIIGSLFGFLIAIATLRRLAAERIGGGR